MSEAKHTPGPWSWFGNANSNSIYLATTHSGRRFVMDFVRWGMRGAQPRFQPEQGVMIDAKDLIQFDVGDRSIVGIDAARRDGSVYRYDIRGVLSADARLIAAAPELLRNERKNLQTLEWQRFRMQELGYPTNELDLAIRQTEEVIAKAEGRSS